MRGAILWDEVRLLMLTPGLICIEKEGEFSGGFYLAMSSCHDLEQLLSIHIAPKIFCRGLNRRFQNEEAIQWIGTNQQGVVASEMHLGRNETWRRSLSAQAAASEVLCLGFLSRSLLPFELCWLTCVEIADLIPSLCLDFDINEASQFYSRDFYIKKYASSHILKSFRLPSSSPHGLVRSGFSFESDLECSITSTHFKTRQIFQEK